MQCAEAMRVQAYFDGEVDAVSALEVERHAEHCPECRSLLENLADTRARMRSELEFPSAPPQLRASLERLLDEETRAATREAAATPDPAATREATATREPGTTREAAAMRESAARKRPRRRAPAFWLTAFGGAGAALAAAVALFVIAPWRASPVLDDLVSAHVRSLMPQHLTDVVSTDRHTVKPWFAGHADVSPVVADFTDQGYRLVGGRADYFDHQRVAAVVYQHGAHLINVFAWVASGPSLPQYGTRSGYHIACWKLGNLQYCAISDTGWDELQGLTRLLRALGAADTPQ
jgi:anti-sigma factor RsiW